MADTLFGDVAVSLCVIAVAIVGIMLMLGRLGIRDGVRVVIGCFLLLGAPLIAIGLQSTAGEAAASGPPVAPSIEAPYATPPLPPATYAPDAGASLERD